ncbi:MAG TPA: LacI family DNA-binding transcriptional regulator [Chloroflexia bacterium]|nr:LacI family DNA-binding transcriptional regulator [Chloroflexia bacterium]
MQTTKRATIRQVAHDSGVSVQTVSRVINGRPDVAESTRLRVQQTIDALGFQPNAVARSLIGRRTHTIGVVGAAIHYFGPSSTLAGIEQQARESGLSVLLALLPAPESQDIGPVLAELLGRQVDGIIWAVPQVGDNRRWLREHPPLPAPIVLLTMPPEPDRAVVAVDNCAGGRLATEHLLAQGYRHIGLITGPLSWWEARERQRGWEEALLAAGLPPVAAQIVEGDWGAASGTRGFARLRAQFPAMDALFASNDQMAQGVLHAAWEAGIGVPGDLGIVGFDDIPEAAYFIPPLTTVCQESTALGGAAVRLLTTLLTAGPNADGAEPPAVRMEPRLVVRQSSIRRAATAARPTGGDA